MDDDQKTLAEEAVELERQFQANRCRTEDRNPWVRKGRLHLLVSAPHAVVHYRDGKKKLHESYTGALALQLHERTGVSAIIYAHTTDEDPNWDTTGLYKTKLKELVKDVSLPPYFVLDLHGLSRTVQRDAIIGTANGKALMGLDCVLVKLKEALESDGLKNIAVDEVFSGAGHNTITSYTYRELKIPAMQLEIGADWRNPASAPKKYVQLFSALCSAIEAIHTLVTEYYERTVPNLQQ
ncbi:MAG: hypothetical protein NVS4B11_23020 [Ktedonobacteraceae bacterium]